MLLLPALPALADDIEVNGTCSFRNAWNSAIQDASRGGCTAGSGADTITLTQDVSLSSEIAIYGSSVTTTITIEGNGHTISGNDSFRLFNFGGGGTRTLTFNNIVVTDSNVSGQNGGAINSYGGNNVITINDSVFHGNGARHGGAISHTSGGSLTINRSAFYDNSASGNGGAIWSNGTLTVTNSTFYNNSASNFGGAIQVVVAAGPRTDLRHNTITGNRAEQGGGFYTGGGQEHLHNNIIWGNTATVGASADCGRNTTSAPALLNTNVGNIIGVSNCGGTAYSTADPKLAASASGHPPFYTLQTGSPAIDAVACRSGITEDQRDMTRPYGSLCDIGAYEWYPPPPPQSSGASFAAGSALVMSPAETCQSLEPDVAVSNGGDGTACQMVKPAGYGHPDLGAANTQSVVDVWGQVMPDTQVCFKGTSGALRYVDTTTMQRTVTSLSTTSEGGMICGTIDRAGQVALVADGSAPDAVAPVAQEVAAQSQSPPAQGQGLSGCMVTTGAILNFRASPGGALLNFTDPWGNRIAGWLPAGVTLTALERSEGWFRVDYHGTQGWISAAYVGQTGTCD